MKTTWVAGFFYVWNVITVCLVVCCCCWWFLLEFSDENYNLFNPCDSKAFVRLERMQRSNRVKVRYFWYTFDVWCRIAIQCNIQMPKVQYVCLKSCINDDLTTKFFFVMHVGERIENESCKYAKALLCDFHLKIVRA